MHEDIIREIKKGNKDAFRSLYDEYASYAIRTAKAITRNDEHAKDAVQEAFIRVYRNISSYDTALSFNAWFYRILGFLYINSFYQLMYNKSLFFRHIYTLPIYTNFQYCLSI